MFPSGRRNGDAVKRPLLRPGLLLMSGVIGIITLTGCRSNQKSALVEAELRTREREIRSMQTDLQREKTMNAALTSELRDRASPCPAPTCAPLSASVEGPATVMAGLIKHIVLGRGTGGIDDDGIPGDEALQVVVVPQDIDGSAVKIPGSLVVQAFEISPEGLKTPLSSWEVSAVELQRTWRSGIFSTGYFVSLQWKKWPSTEKLRVVATFLVLPDNRPFEAERDVRIKLMRLSGRQSLTSMQNRALVSPPDVPDGPVLPGGPAPSRLEKGSSDEGPLLTPGAWIREHASLARDAAKYPSPSEHPPRAQLLQPRLNPDDAAPPFDQ